MNTAGQPVSLGVQIHNSGLLFTTRHDINAWEKLGADLLSFANSSTWWIADWLVYGETTFQDRYKEAVKRTALSYQTLRNYTWVARRFPLSRRRQTLSFSHHLEVVALDQPQQDYWLRTAEKLHWSRNKLRLEVRGSLSTQHDETAPAEIGRRLDLVAAEPAADVTDSLQACDGVTAVHEPRLLHLQLSAEDLIALEKAASKEGVQVGHWATRMLRLAATQH